MILMGKNLYRKRTWFAWYPFVIGYIGDRRVWIWLEPYHWSFVPTSCAHIIIYEPKDAAYCIKKFLKVGEQFKPTESIWLIPGLMHVGYS